MFARVKKSWNNQYLQIVENKKISTAGRLGRIPEKRGLSKDHRQGLKLMKAGIVLNWPVNEIRYILGERMRNVKEVGEKVLSGPGHYVKVYPWGNPTSATPPRP